jgi:hypothetical protein
MAAIGQQQQAAHDREVLEELDALLGIGHLVVKDQGGGHSEQQQQDRPGASIMPAIPANPTSFPITACTNIR